MKRGSSTALQEKPDELIRYPCPGRMRRATSDLAPGSDTVDV
jgi:hypothetical protein